MSTFTGWQGPFSGEGKFSINGGADQVPYAIDWALDAITSPKIRIVGTVVPRKILYAGSVGFSYSENDGTGTARDFVVYARQLDWEYGDISLSDFFGTGNTAQAMWYRLRPGVSMWLGAWYA